MRTRSMTVVYDCQRHGEWTQRGLPCTEPVVVHDRDGYTVTEIPAEFFQHLELILDGRAPAMAREPDKGSPRMFS